MRLLMFIFLALILVNACPVVELTRLIIVAYPQYGSHLALSFRLELFAIWSAYFANVLGWILIWHYVKRSDHV